MDEILLKIFETSLWREVPDHNQAVIGKMRRKKSCEGQVLNDM